MDRKEKEAKKKIIRERIDLGNGRYKDYEVDKLVDVVSNPDKYDGRAKTIRHSGRGISSDGNYFWDDEATYTITNNESGVRINREYNYHDDEYNRHENNVYRTGREILTVLGEVFRDR
ncbi:MAG: hypothetical protein LUI10_12295 [Lachnospiraceae bacterium]|nr:hypothetical protein [Lachnospiraceae bacterium]